MWEPVVCKYCVLGLCSLWLRLGSCWGDSRMGKGCSLQHGRVQRGSSAPQHHPVAHPSLGERCNPLYFPGYNTSSGKDLTFVTKKCLDFLFFKGVAQ